MNRVTSALLLIISVVLENQTNKTFGYTTAITNNINYSYWALQFQFSAYTIIVLGII